MKTIIAEKPSVAREIARIVGATKREEGYFEGGGYAVTWAFGHLVQLAMPDGYGVRGFVRDNLPIIPDTFTLVPRQVRTEKGYKPDSGVVSQIKVIKRLFDTSEHIIVATDAGREGELIFRYLYHYTGCTTPFVRLWISSLTDKAIREGLRKLEDGSKYDNLYLAAKARSESDWLVGINGTQALSIAAGHGTYSVGRVQTPTLAMVCERYWENRRFTSEAFWQLHIATDGCDGEVVKFSSSEKWKSKEPATELYNKVKAAGSATVTKAERKEKTEETPLLYDLTTLQKEANAKHGFTAEQTLEIAQKLYEKKLITYPRTGSRYIPEDVFAEIPKLLAFIGTQPEWKDKVRAKAAPTRRSVDDGKVTDHHALLVTGEKPLFLSKEDNTIYQMIAGRMVEAFSEKCVKDVTTVTAECAGVEFTVKGSVVKQTGWRAVYGEEKEEITIPGWQEGDTLTPKGSSITEGKTKPKPLHTEATLLSAMETAGKEIEDDALRQPEVSPRAHRIPVAQDLQGVHRAEARATQRRLDRVREGSFLSRHRGDVDHLARQRESIGRVRELHGSSFVIASRIPAHSPACACAHAVRETQPVRLTPFLRVRFIVLPSAHDTLCWPVAVCGYRFFLVRRYPWSIPPDHRIRGFAHRGSRPRWCHNHRRIGRSRSAHATRTTGTVDGFLGAHGHGRRRTLHPQQRRSTDLSGWARGRPLA